MKPYSLPGLIAVVALCVGLGAHPVLAEGDSTSRLIGQEPVSVSEEVVSITLPYPVHFSAKDGSDLIATPGKYRVEAAEANLRLVPLEGQDAMLLAADKGSHDVKVEVPIALSIPGGTTADADIHVVQLLSPDGSSLEAVGTYSGVRSRGVLDAARNAAAQANAEAERARQEAARRLQEAAQRAQQLALAAKQAAERQAKMAACKVAVATIKAGRLVGAFMQQALSVARQRHNELRQRLAQDLPFRGRLLTQMKNEIANHLYAVPELGRINALMNNPANRDKMNALFTPDILCHGSMAAFDTKLGALGLVPNFAMVRPRGVDDSHFYTGIQLTLDGALIGGAQLGLLGVTDFRGNGGFYFFIGPEGGIVAGVSGVLEAMVFPNVDLGSFAGWGGGVGASAGDGPGVAVDAVFDQSFTKFQGFGVGGGVGVDAGLAGSYTYAWKL